MSSLLQKTQQKNTIESSKNTENTMGHIICLFDTYFGNSRLDVPFSRFIFVSCEISWGPAWGLLQISSDRYDWMGAKIKTQENPSRPKFNPQKTHAEFPSHKNFQRNYTARICGYHTQELSRIFRLSWIPNKIPS